MTSGRDFPRRHQPRQGTSAHRGKRGWDLFTRRAASPSLLEWLLKARTGTFIPASKLGSQRSLGRDHRTQDEKFSSRLHCCWAPSRPGLRGSWDYSEGQLGNRLTMSRDCSMLDLANKPDVREIRTGSLHLRLNDSATDQRKTSDGRGVFDSQ